MSSPRPVSPLLCVAGAGSNWRPSTPSGDRHGPIEHFRDPEPRTSGRLRWQRARRIEPALDDLVVGLRQAVLPELPDDINRDVIAAGDVAVEKKAGQDRDPGQFRPPLFRKLPPQGLEKRLADLDPATRQMPAGDIAVPDQKHLVIAVEH